MNQGNAVLSEGAKHSCCAFSYIKRTDQANAHTGSGPAVWWEERGVWCECRLCCILRS